MKVEIRQIKYPRIEYRTGDLLFIVPPGIDYQSLNHKYNKWIKTKEQEIQSAIKEAKNIKITLRSVDELKLYVDQKVKEFSDEYGLVVDRIIFRDLKSKWGSCSQYGNLTFNNSLRFLPHHYIDYIVFHETMHLIERKHTPHFWELINEKFKDYKEIESHLFSYWFAIRR